MRKTFSTIDRIQWDTDEYNYHSLKVKVNQHCNILDKQVFTLDLLKMFYETDGLLALTLHAKQHYHEEQHTDNMFDLPEQIVSYDFNFKDIELDNSAIYPVYGSELEKYLSTFINYLSNVDQNRVLKWFIEQADTFNAEFNVNRHTKEFDVVLTNIFLHYCAKQAYGDDYTLLSKQIMEKTLPVHEEKPLPKRKI